MIWNIKSQVSRNSKKVGFWLKATWCSRSKKSGTGSLNKNKIFSSNSWKTVSWQSLLQVSAQFSNLDGELDEATIREIYENDASWDTSCESPKSEKPRYKNKNKKRGQKKNSPQNFPKEDNNAIYDQGAFTTSKLKTHRWKRKIVNIYYSWWWSQTICWRPIATTNDPVSNRSRGPSKGFIWLSVWSDRVSIFSQ